jgi:saccharopine dehydrogenase (NAD+, L-lysine-forming)
MNGSLKVALLGAGGTIAPAIVRDLAESDEVESLLLMDIDEGRARATGEAHGLDKWSARAVDARSGLAAAIHGCDLLVNSAGYRINRDAMRACIDAGCHYIDLGGLYWETTKQLELSSEFERIGRLALLGMGSSPGKTNVMGVAAVRALGRKPRSVTVAAAGRDLSPPGGGLSVPYALRTMIDELTLEPVVVEDGRPREIEPLSAGGALDFGDPIGEADTIYTLHSEVLTFPQSFGCSESSFRLSLKRGLIDGLRELTSATPEQIEQAAKTVVPPSPNTVSAHVVEASDGERAVRVLARTGPIERWGIGGGVVSTGTPASAAVRLIARGKIDATGAMPPERCVDPDDLFGELETRNCRFETSEREAVGG